MKKDLLICIAFHYSEERLQYLHKVIKNIVDNYKCSWDMIIDTNVSITNKWFVGLPLNINVVSHENLKHPFHLTWQHRKHFKENIDKYENFYYTEDDILLPYENYLNYLENFKILLPLNCVPAMIRIEEKGGEQFVVDIVESESARWITHTGSKRTFCRLGFGANYNGFWIMPRLELIGTMIPNFVREHESRETAASYVAWELIKNTMIEIKNNEINPLCYSFHLPNNYTNNPDSPNGKINVKDVFM